MAQPTEGVLSSEESANTLQSSNVLTLLRELKAAHALIRELQDEKTRRTTVSPAGKASHSGGNAWNGNTHHTWGTDNELHRALSLLSSYRTANPQLRGGQNLTKPQTQDVVRAMKQTWPSFQDRDDGFLETVLQNVKPSEGPSTVPWSISGDQTEQHASAYNPHPFLFPPCGTCLCCSDRSVLVMTHFRRFSSSSSNQSSRNPFFVYLDGAGAVPSSFFCGTCSICNAQFFYSYYTDHNGTARFYDSTSSRPFLLLCHKMARSACALDMKLLERYRLLLAHGHLTMTAYMEMHNSLFNGDSLDKGQISDYTNVLLVTKFLESMVPISTVDVTPFVGRNHRRKEDDGFEPFLLNVLPYVRFVFMRYWGQHFARTQNLALSSVELYTWNNGPPLSFDTMLTMKPVDFAAHLLPRTSFPADGEVSNTGCRHPSCCKLVTVDGHAKVVRDTCSDRSGQVVASPELGNVILQCPNRPMYKNRVQGPVCASCSVAKTATVMEEEVSEPEPANVEPEQPVITVGNSSTPLVLDANVEQLETAALEYHEKMVNKFFRYPVERLDPLTWPIMKIASVEVTFLEMVNFMHPVPVICVNYYDPRRRKPRTQFEYTRYEEVHEWLENTPNDVQEKGLLAYEPLKSNNAPEIDPLNQKSSLISSKSSANQRRDERAANRTIPREQSVFEFLGGSVKKSAKAAKSGNRRKTDLSFTNKSTATDKGSEATVDHKVASGDDVIELSPLDDVQAHDQDGVTLGVYDEDVVGESCTGDTMPISLGDVGPEDVAELNTTSAFTFDRIVSSTSNPTGNGVRYMVRYHTQNGIQEVMHTANELPNSALKEWHQRLISARKGQQEFSLNEQDGDDKKFMCPGNDKEKNRYDRMYCETAGIAMVITNCGVAIDIYELHGAESSTQVYMNMLDFSDNADELFGRLAAWMYDNGCNLHSFTRRRQNLSARALLVSRKDIRVDKLHFRNHSTDPAKVPSAKGKTHAAYCRDNCNPYDNAVSRRENSGVCEEEFRHTAKFKFGLRYMRPGRFGLTLFAVMDERNARKLASDNFKKAAQRLDRGIKPKMNPGHSGKRSRAARAADSGLEVQCAVSDVVVHNVSGIAAQSLLNLSSASYDGPVKAKVLPSNGKRRKRVKTSSIDQSIITDVLHCPETDTVVSKEASTTIKRRKNRLPVSAMTHHMAASAAINK